MGCVKKECNGVVDFVRAILIGKIGLLFPAHAVYSCDKCGRCYWGDGSLVFSGELEVFFIEGHLMAF